MNTSLHKLFTVHRLLFTDYCSLFTRLIAVASLACLAGVCLAEDDPQIGDKPLSELVKQLQSKNRGEQVRAARALVAAPAEVRPTLMPLMMPLLKSERENDRFVAAQVLGECGPMARTAVPELLQLLQGTQFERNRAAAAKALGQILKDAQASEEIDKVALALAAKFNEDYDQYSDVRRESVRSIGMIGPAAKKAIPKLVKGLTDFQLYSVEHQEVRRQAAWTCGRMGPLAAEHVDRLITMLNAEGENIHEIVVALGSIGPVQENIAPNILNFMESNGRHGVPARNMVETWQALQKFGVKAEQAIPFTRRFMTNLLTSQNPYPAREEQLCVIEAMKFLQVAGPKAVEALPELNKMANYTPGYGDAVTPLVRQEAAKTAGILKGMASGNAEKVAPAAEKK